MNRDEKARAEQSSYNKNKWSIDGLNTLKNIKYYISPTSENADLGQSVIMVDIIDFQTGHNVPESFETYNIATKSNVVFQEFLPVGDEITSGNEEQAEADELWNKEFSPIHSSSSSSIAKKLKNKKKGSSIYNYLKF
jgi:hypothetical protein